MQEKNWIYVKNKILLEGKDLIWMNRHLHCVLRKECVFLYIKKKICSPEQIKIWYNSNRLPMLFLTGQNILKLMNKEWWY